jgi:peptide/nickel transport system permease protein
MIQYIVKRIFYMIPTLFAISVVSFIVISIPPGDFVDQLVTQARMTGEIITAEEEAGMRMQYGLGASLPEQYLRWISAIVTRGDFGISFRLNLPVSQLIWERLALTFLLSLSSMLFIWAVAIPIGIYSAVRRYSPGDYLATFIAFVGVAIPDFLIALVLLYVSFRFFGQSVGGLFSKRHGRWLAWVIFSPTCGYR